MWENLKSKFDNTDSFVSLALGLAVVLVIGMTIVNYIKSKQGTATNTETTQQQEEKNATTAPGKHTVKEGETLWSIAESYYKSGYNWVDIQKANNLTNPDVIEAGTVLTIPVATPIPTPAGEVSSASVTNKPKDNSYTVVHGDDLWNISVKEYGTGYRWTDIAAANKLTNPGLIHAGNVLVMP